MHLCRCTGDCTPRKPADDALRGLRHAAAAMRDDLPRLQHQQQPASWRARATMPPRPLAARVAVAVAVAMAVAITIACAGCSSVRLDAPTVVTAPAAPRDDQRYPAPQPRVWTQPPVETALPAPTEIAAQVAPVPAADPAPLAPMTDAAPADRAPTSTSAATAPATSAAAASTAAVTASGAASANASASASDAASRASTPGGDARVASATLPAAGRWSVQVGVFAVAANADALRARVAARLPDATVRTVRRDARVHVLVGEAADRAAAQQLAQQLRTSLRQDVVLFRW